MVRLLLSCLLTVLSTTVLMASPLSRAEARQRATMFLSLRNSAAARAAQPTEAPVLTDAATPSPSYYAFNIGKGEGFVIVGAEDCPQAVIGYNDSGSFNAATLPANARAWLEGLNGQNNAQSAHIAHPAHQRTAQRAA